VCPIEWAAPLERVFNGGSEIYLLSDRPDSGLTRHTLSNKPMAAACEIIIDKVYEHYGPFTTCPGCLTPMTDSDDEPVVWHQTQQLILP
jgi:hypothetical protein